MNDSKKSLLPVLVAVGSGLTALPATAIELSEINVQSTLGQPLRASIAYALGPNEQLADYCVTLKPGLQSAGLPAISRADVSVAGGVISLTGKTVIREPLMTVRVDVACPYTPNLSREYMLFIDPAIPVTAAVATNEVATPPATQGASAQQQRPVRRSSTRRAAAVRTPIDMSARYLVQPGDSLSQIAERLENRPVGLWDAVAQIFDANPDAFVDNDMNRLKAGSWLVIPSFADDNSVAVNAAIVRAPIENSAVDTSSPIDTTSAVKTTVDDTEVLEPATMPDVTDLRPGDLVVDREKPVIVINDANVVIPDTELDEPTTASTPNVPTASIAVPDDPAQPTTNWLLWLLGGGIALIAGLLLFGRRNREEYEPAPIAPVAPHPMRRDSDSMTVEVLAEPDYDLDDDSPTAENLALDADLVVGTGLQGSTDMDVNQDFGFAATTDLDFEFPEESESVNTPETNMLAVPTIEEAIIVDDEVLPDDEDYDMSVIVDATKMPRSDEVTERDLKAVEIESGDQTLIENNYTVSQEVDYQILEQDYEEELTATQALNIEIEKAAAELAKRMDGIDGNDQTSEMKLATVTELDVTSKLPSNGGSVSDRVDSGIDEDVTEEMVAEEQTVEMPKSNNDDTVEMPSESGKVDTKAG